MVHFITPYRLDKDLGRAYNEAISMLPDGDHVCLMDIDVMFLLPEQPAMIIRAAQEYHNSLITCKTGRISASSAQKGYDTGGDVAYAVQLARALHRTENYPVRTKRPISGFLMCFPVSMWKQFKFKEGIGCLGVDTDWSTRLLRAGVNIFVLQNVYVYHLYRLENGIQNKNHLL